VRLKSVVPTWPAEIAHVLTHVEVLTQRLSQASLAVWNMSTPSANGQPRPLAILSIPAPAEVPPTRLKPKVGRWASLSTSKIHTGKFDSTPPSTIVELPVSG